MMTTQQSMGRAQEAAQWTSARKLLNLIQSRAGPIDRHHPGTVRVGDDAPATPHLTPAIPLTILLSKQHDPVLVNPGKAAGKVADKVADQPLLTPTAGTKAQRTDRFSWMPIIAFQKTNPGIFSISTGFIM